MGNILRGDLKKDIEFIKKLPIIPAATSKKEEDFLREVATFQVLNQEEQGHPINFTYGDGKNTYQFKLIHGGKYQLPRFLARWIDTRSKPVYTWKVDAEKGHMPTPTSFENRFQARQVYGE